MASLQLILTQAAVFSVLARAQEQTLLSTVASKPELSVFSAVVNGSGGAQLNPALEERFNSALDGRNYTAFVPTDEAFAKISPSLLDALITAPAYPLLESIIRTHIAEGLTTSANIISVSPVEAIQGFPLMATSADDAVLINNQAQIVAADTSASNGVIHAIDQVLNPYTAYFGISNATNSPSATESDGTIADILNSDSRLNDLRDVLNALQPDFVLRRLASVITEEGVTQQQIFAAPSNAAFAAAPAGTVDAAQWPSNQDLSFQLFSFGLVEATRLADLVGSGSTQLPNVFTGINITASRTTPDGALTLNNAVVEEEICGSNGCVWIVDRIFDPLYLAFGPVDRA